MSKTKKELELLLSNTVLMPKMYSFEQVRKLLKFHESELKKQRYDGVSAWMNYGKKYKFWDFFREEIDKEHKNELKIADKRWQGNEKFREENGELLIELDSCDKKWRKLVKERIGALVRIHEQLSKEIVGSNDFHVGSIQTLQNLERDILNNS